MIQRTNTVKRENGSVYVKFCDFVLCYTGVNTIMDYDILKPDSHHVLWRKKLQTLLDRHCNNLQILSFCILSNRFALRI